MMVRRTLQRPHRGDRPDERRGVTRGFTLTELAVVLAIVAILLRSLMYTLSAQTEQRNRDETLRRLEQSKELLLAFAIVNGRLPCPARCSNAPAATGGDAATSSRRRRRVHRRLRRLPARRARIGFQPIDAAGYALDAWDNRIRYAVAQTSSGAQPQRTSPTPAQPEGQRHHRHADATCWSAPHRPRRDRRRPRRPAAPRANVVTNQSVVAAVVWSQGKNWRDMPAGQRRRADQQQAPAAGDAERQRPSSGTTRARSAPTGGEFDDLLVWIPVGQLYGRLISAGVLP